MNSESQLPLKKIQEKLILLLGLVSPLAIISINGYSIFFYMLLICGVTLFIANNGVLKIDLLFSVFIFILFLTTVFSYLNSIGRPWERRSLKGFLTIMLIAIVYFLLNGNRNKIALLYEFRKGIKWSININVFWSLLQIFFAQTLGIDLNTLIFVDKLHLVTIGSAYRGSFLVATGLHWHPANLAPLLLLGFLLDKRLWYRLLLLGVAILSYNSTNILGIILCIFFSIGFWLLQKRRQKGSLRLTANELVLTIFNICIIIILLVSVVKSGLIDRFGEVVGNFVSKISFDGSDSSSSVHLSYYQLLPSILEKMPISKLLLGYGYGCSGYWYSVITGQYSFFDTWAVESDVINNILGLGFLNSIALYLWIFFIGIKGKKINKKCFFFIFILFIQGFSYNVLFDWVIFLLCILKISISSNFDFFNLYKRGESVGVGYSNYSDVQQSGNYLSGN